LVNWRIGELVNWRIGEWVNWRIDKLIYFERQVKKDV